VNNIFFSQYQHRKAKRKLEMNLIISHLNKLIDNKKDKKDKKDIKILEFGSGDGFQLEFLSKLGSVIGSDLENNLSTNIGNAKFIKCSITETPFEDDFFDIIFSNHVMEHIENLDKAFIELKRIGNDQCFYAFSVPTNFWLLASLPAQYFYKVRSFFLKFTKIFNKKQGCQKHNSLSPKSLSYHSSLRNVFSLLLPRGHGVISNFFDCYTYFKVGSWRKLFKESGFDVDCVLPLFSYGPSELPITPIIKCKSFCCCSSVLFIIRKNNSTV
jgi:ubiquinone/menaquinone biosynthesis C-methylase UbiE